MLLHIINALKQHIHELGRNPNSIVAKMIKNILKLMHHLFELLKPHCSGGAFERMSDTENGLNRFWHAAILLKLQ
ncbi:hypothetical protein D3C86_1857100 [compost metagenome]